MEIELSYLPVLPRERSTPIGCIGAGFIMSDCHLVAYRAADFNPVAIADPDAAKRTAAAERHRIPRVYESAEALMADPEVEVLDIAVPPDRLLPVIRQAVQHAGSLRGILAQKPIGSSFAQAAEIVRLCREAGIVLAVNQNMRYDQSVRACKDLLGRGLLGEPVLATVEMRAIPHWMPWQESQGWCTLRIMSIHHLDTFRYWFGDPDRIYASVRPDPRTRFSHSDGICLYILEYDQSGLRASAWDDVWTGPSREGAGEDISIRWRVEGTKGMARGTIGWPRYPDRAPSTLDYTTVKDQGAWHQPRWKEVWFPDAFAGPMAELLVALETGKAPALSGEDNLGTMALVEAAYESAETHAPVSPHKFLEGV
ncbi:MAG: Gfo/Idh/MocA family oxidoreductase [Candidatus Glassbacteria bacterium]|nr:Gfo/Idh/MocA family oxidoreductase [Candidatus Glassbacteria bacterium]